MVEPLSFDFRVFTLKLVGVRIFRNFMVSKLVNKCLTVETVTPFSSLFRICTTLVQSHKRTPNIFYASSKRKNQLMFFSISINKPRLCRGSKSYFISK